ncbi:MAG: ornithine cyclodeaminase family protein [Deltaproteobacteria bacterium]|nr:ornithine cyclodeaminase family protein [Deltaproteobacteria bacterium]
MLLIDRKETEPHISVERGIEVVEDAFRELGENPTINHPRRRLDVYQEGWSQRRLNVFAAALPLKGYVGTLLRLDHIQNLHDGKRIAVAGGSPFDRQTESVMFQESMRRVYVLFDLASGMPAAIQYGGTGRLSPMRIRALHPEVVSLRTTATSVVGIKHLACDDAPTLGLLGTGGFAPSHLVGICAVRNIKTIKVFSPTREHRERFSQQMAEIMGREITPVEDARSAVEDSDIVMCCTNSIIPVFEGDWLKPGATVACIVGMNKEYGKRDEHFSATEVDDTTIKRSQVIVVNSIEQAIQDEQGTLWERVQRGLIDWSQVLELGELVAGKTPGRTSREQICFFHNNAGQGVADLAIAIEHYETARRFGLGTPVAGLEGV